MILLPAGDVLSMGIVMMKAIVRATCKLRGDGDSKESEQSIKTKYNSKKLAKQGGVRATGSWT